MRSASGSSASVVARTLVILLNGHSGRHRSARIPHRAIAAEHVGDVTQGNEISAGADRATFGHDGQDVVRQTSQQQDNFSILHRHTSFPDRDQDFAERLYADLQNQGVRCWFAPEDLKIGEKFWHRIDESIRLYDKLLVVLSEYSVTSVWVENEVMAALEKEHQQQKLVLFPIKLDEAVMQTSLPWAANIRRTRHMGDFTNWKNHGDYQKGLNRLLRDLKAST